MSRRTIVLVWLALALAALVTRLDAAEPARACLALAAFTEARSDGVAGMSAVIGVALDRATDARHRWPRTPCAVVMQPRQFAGVERWQVPRMPTPREFPIWARALDLAGSALRGARMLPPECRGATSFDRGANVHGLQQVCKIGSHTFYTQPLHIGEVHK